MEMSQIQNSQRTMGMDAKLFNMLLFIGSVVMAFAALSSAYIVKKGDGNWLEFELPTSLMINTVVIALSSVTMHMAYHSARKDNLKSISLYTGITLVLGVAFLIGQWKSWGDLVDMNVFLVGNVSGSFVYLISGFHGLHIISGVIFLIIVLVSSFKQKIHSKRMLQMEMCTIYWHFLDGLWIYLYFFLKLNN